MLELRTEDQADQAPSKQARANPKVITAMEVNISKRPRKLLRPWLRSKEPWKEDVSLTKKHQAKPFEKPPEPQLAVSEFSAEPELFNPSLENPRASPLNKVVSELNQVSPDLDSSMDKFANRSAVSHLLDPKDLPSPVFESSHEKAISKFIQMKSAKQTLAHPRKPEDPIVKKNRIGPGSRPEHVSQANVLRKVLKSTMKKSKSEEEWPLLTQETRTRKTATSSCSTSRTSARSWKISTSLRTPG